MNITTVFISLFLILNLSFSCKSVFGPDANALIDQVRNEYAPDKRVAIFDISLVGDTLRGVTNLPAAKGALLNLISDTTLVDEIEILEPSFGLVNVSVCNIRSDPRHSAELSTQALLGQILRIYKEENNWFWVQTPDGYLGWLDDGGLTHLSAEGMRQWLEADKVVISKPFDLVLEIDTDEVLSDVVEGNILALGESTTGRSEVIFPDGRKGYISSHHVMPYEQLLSLDQNLPDNIISTAMSFMGRPYLWGGTSGKGVDCSGFTKTVYFLNGLELPRDASQQVKVGEDVETDSTLRNLMIGDFLFFGRKQSADLPEKITHVAIYLGEGRIIHSSDRVQIESLHRGDPDFAANRLETLVRAKRMLDNVGDNGVVKLSSHHYY